MWSFAWPGAMKLLRRNSRSKRRRPDSWARRGTVRWAACASLCITRSASTRCKRWWGSCANFSGLGANSPNLSAQDRKVLVTQEFCKLLALDDTEFHNWEERRRYERERKSEPRPQKHRGTGPRRPQL